MLRPSIAVLDCSAVVSWAQQREGWEAVSSLLSNENIAAYIHRQNATEFWYQTHRQGALAAFMRANPIRVRATGQNDLTGINFQDASVFQGATGKQIADDALALLQTTGVEIVGDEAHPELWKRAAEIKSQYRRVSLADCFGVALAIELNAPFWTSDRHELTALAEAGAAQIHFIR